jgi:hypothetical protein
MRTAFFAALIASSLVAAPAALAHHSAARFDPHTKIVLEITDEKGTRDVEFEGHSLNNYYRGGWREGLVKVGDKITLQAAPTKDGTDGGYALGVIAADGTKF